MSRGHPSDRDIARYARARHGVLGVAELEDLGLSARAVRHRVSTGRLHRLHRGVYAVEPPTAKARWRAGLLACGPHAVLSHASAAALWGIAENADTVHVVVPNGARKTESGIVVHGAVLAPAEIVRLDGMASTGLARTLLDLAATTDSRRVARAVERAEELRVFDLVDLRELVERRRGERGTKVLADIVGRYDDTGTTRSTAEARLLDLVEAAGLSRPVVNAWIALPEGGGYRPDFLWKERRLIVEVDGRAYHARRRAFEHDRKRDRRLALAGYETRRYAAREVMRQPTTVIAEISAFLDH